MPSEAARELSRLRWQCRRGMLELDEILERYLDCCYAAAPPQEQEAFRRLLAQHDPDLQRWLLLDQRPVDQVLCDLIERLRSLSP